MTPPESTRVLEVRAVRERYPWIEDDRAARRIIAQAGGRIIAGRWAIPLDLLDRWERAWHRPGVARKGDKSPAQTVDLGGVKTTDIPDALDADWWRSEA